MTNPDPLRETLEILKPALEVPGDYWMATVGYGGPDHHLICVICDERWGTPEHEAECFVPKLLTWYRKNRAVFNQPQHPVAPVMSEAMLKDIEHYCTPELVSEISPQAILNLIASHRTLQAPRPAERERSDKEEA